LHSDRLQDDPSLFGGSNDRECEPIAAAGLRHLKRPLPLREPVYEALTEMIIDGSLRRGQHLVEVDLAKMLTS